MSYREPGELPFYPTGPTIGPVREKCPECHLSLAMYECLGGHKHEFTPETAPNMANKPGCYREYCTKRLQQRFFTCYCSPKKRRHYGFLWLFVCNKPGTHVHQACSRCGWEDIALPPDQ